MERLRITGGRVLLRSDGEQAVDVSLEDGRIAGIDRGGRGAELDARGLLVLPGIVDIHGDAFERQLQPRPGVGFRRRHRAARHRGAVAGERHHHRVPRRDAVVGAGAAQPDAWQALLDALEARRWTCDMRVHLRWEAYNLEALDIALADIAAGRVHLLAFNDHTPPILKKIKDPVAGAKYSDRAGMKLDDFRALAEQVGARAPAVPAGAGTDCRRGARGRPADGEPRRRRPIADAAGVPRARRADLRIPDGRGGRAGGARRRRLGGDGLPERGARRLASRLDVRRADGRGRHLQRAVVRLFLSGDAARGVGAGGARRARSAARMGADLGQSGRRGRACRSRRDRARDCAPTWCWSILAIPRVVATIAGGRIAFLPPRARRAFCGILAL